MPKKAYIPTHFSSDELKKDPVESRRWHLLWKVSQGWTVKNAALAVRINYDYGKEILKKYNESGAEGVKNLKNKTLRFRCVSPACQSYKFNLPDSY